MVYKRNAAPLFPQRFSFTSPVPVTHHQSRKQFFARMFGIGAAFSVFPKLFAKSTSTALESAQPRIAAPGIEIRRDARAVARRHDSV